MKGLKPLIFAYRAYSKVGCYFPTTHPPMAHCRESGGEKEGWSDIEENRVVVESLSDPFYFF